MARTSPVDAASEEGVAHALEISRPSRAVAFRRGFDATGSGESYELLKDLVAMANSGGGAIVVGVDRGGTPSRWDSGALLAAGGAAIGEQLEHHLGEPFDDFELHPATKDGEPVAVITVGARTDAPLVFARTGAYADGDGGERTAFAAGAVYFRHGGRSAPGTTQDLRRFMNREIERQRKAWLANIRQVARAPRGAQVLVVKPPSSPDLDLTGVHVVEDPNAPAVARTDFDVTHPFRQTEAIKRFNDRVKRTVMGPYDMQCVRRVHGIDRRPEFFHRPKFGSPQYSEAFIAWLVDEYHADPNVFEEAKAVVKAERATSRAASQRPGD
jgi:hypothetical protein